MATTEELQYVNAVLESERTNEWNMTTRNRIASAQAVVARLVEGDETVTETEVNFVVAVLDAQRNKTWNLTRRNRLSKAIAIMATV